MADDERYFNPLAPGSIHRLREALSGDIWRPLTITATCRVTGVSRGAWKRWEAGTEPKGRHAALIRNLTEVLNALEGKLNSDGPEMFLTTPHPKLSAQRPIDLCWMKQGMASLRRLLRTMGCSPAIGRANRVE